METSQETATVTIPENSSHFTQLNNLMAELRRTSNKYYWTGVIVTLIGLAGIISIYWFINFHFDPKEEKILSELAQLDKKTGPIVAYELGTKLIYGSLFTAIFFFLFQLARNSFDQSVRYLKRRHSIHILEFLYQSKERTTVDEKIRFFEALTKTVESAFTNNEKSEYKSLLDKVVAKLDTIKSIESNGNKISS